MGWFAEVCRRRGLKVNTGKSKVMVLNGKENTGKSKVMVLNGKERLELLWLQPPSLQAVTILAEHGDGGPQQTTET